MNAHGRILLESLVSMGVSSLLISSLAALSSTISQTAARVSQAHQGIVASTKVYSTLSSALKTRERNRLAFATIVTQSPNFFIGLETIHPLKSMKGATAPRDSSDVLSVIDIAHRSQGRVVAVAIAGSSITATVCGLAHRPSPDEFKSYLFYSVDVVHQVTGSVSPISPSCVEVRGSSISGLVTTRREFLSAPILFAPVEREYSLFVDTTSTFRIASHVGARLTENQPITSGIAQIRLEEDAHGRGISTFAITIKPSIGKPLMAFVTPGLAQRRIWNEVLP